MLPLWFGYGDFDGGYESAVEDDRQDHVFLLASDFHVFIQLGCLILFIIMGFIAFQVKHHPHQ
jgi:hypothetical protein